MISHKYKFIFIHIPKCAGSSLFYSEKEKYGIDYRLHLQNGHYTQKSYYDQYGDILDNYIQFMICRNPFDRIVSAFEFLKKGGMWRGDQKFADTHNLSNSSFSDFIKKMIHFENESEYFNKVHFYSMYSFIEHKPKKIEYLRFEYLDSEVPNYFARHNLPTRKIPHKNKTKHKHYTEYYDEETKQIVAERYAKDIEYFNYKFGE